MKLVTKGNLDLNNDYTQIDIYSGSGKRIKFPEGLDFSIKGIDELRIFENSTPEFDTINISGSLKVITEELDSSGRMQVEADKVLFKIYEDNNIIKYDGVLEGVSGNIEELKSIPKVFRGSKVIVSRIEHQDGGHTSLQGLEIHLPKKYIKNEMNNQLRKNLVKDFGRVGELKVRVKKEIKLLFKIKFQWTIAKIGLYVRVMDANLKRFVFTGENNFQFKLNGRVRLKTKHLRETKNIREIRGIGSININLGSSIDQTKISVAIKEQYVDIENFPGEIEQYFEKKLRETSLETVTFSPFEKLSSEEKQKLSKVTFENNITISETDKYFIFKGNAKISPQ